MSRLHLHSPAPASDVRLLLGPFAIALAVLGVGITLLAAVVLP